MFSENEEVVFLDNGIIENGIIVQIIKDSALISLSESRMCVKPLSKLYKKEMTN